MELWIGAINLGLLYSFLAIGMYIAFKIFRVADLTVDGSFTTGASVSAVMLVAGVNPFLCVIAAIISGVVAGFFTGIISTKFKINSLLAGIIVMTGLYSVHLRIMGKSNVPLLGVNSINTVLLNFNPGINNELWLMLCLLAIVSLFGLLFSIFLKTDFGIVFRAVGDNKKMCSANGINTNAIFIVGTVITNGLAALSGSLVSQYQGFSDVSMGVGSIVFSLASVIIGDAIFRKDSIFIKIFGVLVGSIIFRLLIALSLYAGLNPNDLKLITAIFVLMTLAASNSILNKKTNNNNNKWKYLSQKKYMIIAIFFLFVILPITIKSIYKQNNPIYKIGLVSINDAGIYKETIIGFNNRMKELGYNNHDNIEIIEQNANGDVTTLNSIIDNFITKDVKIIIAISTQATQSALTKAKDRAIVFATVANPFSIKAGVNDSNHISNVTGVYGGMPVKDMFIYLNRIYPNGIKLGCIYDNALANSEYNVEKAKEDLVNYPKIKLTTITVSNSNEVNQNANSILNKIEGFFLVNDATVNASFESVYKASLTKNIPIFAGDVDLLPRGATFVVGFDYMQSGIQAAQLVDRIIKGEKPSEIKFEQYSKKTLGINLDMVEKLGLIIPDEILRSATITFTKGTLNKIK